MASSLTKDAAAQVTPASGGKTFFGHPRGLATLFMTEMWERFSFYGMRALLVLYLVAPAAKGGLGFAAATAAAIYSVYNATVYLLAMPGGWIADRLWGPRKTVAVAGTIIMIGHFLLAVPVEISFFVGLVFIAIGSGLLKANISTMVGHLYPDRNDPRRDGGFTIFYMGINLGAFAAPLVIGTIGQNVNWHLGFALAGVGMALGLAQYLLGTRHLAPVSNEVPAPMRSEERTALLRKAGLWALAAVVFYVVVLATGSFTINWVLWPLSLAGIALPAWYFVRIHRDRDLTSDERSKMTGYVWFFIAAAVFWMIYDQSGSTLTVFAQDHTAGRLWGVGFPSSWFQSLNPLYIMALAPVVAALWVKLRSKNPSTTVKFAYGLLGIGISFGVMMMAQAAASGGAKVTPLWLALVYLIQTVAELCLSPVGLSVSTKLAPAKYAGQIMGLWFLAVTAGDCVAAITQLVLGNAFLSQASFAVQGAIAALAGVAFVLWRKKVIRLMGDVH
ncbi:MULTISPECIES: peptide MFS transporter [Streptomycetaceae]|uniref:Di-tripeptide transporter n=1 Tax=Streptantibioticus cattleyicolor (strain ATCC 35852 / DSM 46488 / JCM 4925 / NBRC 14057 / NRRL 8057) TaxID=1003195 RepID=F8JVE5_STREN|nr:MULTISPECIES: oligopeptide:H+ symporter [Streptomycetaceae]AEW94427.1 di-tripeptide transporter [Streptantibioticus cattleyicolor NRRL 8057 = DSM 46488]MYS59075.1 MFS transporter [Streptomyces sp. SID5468]CCB74785.1 Di-/tripeptide transporter [Streptantibioticus cattleyicolor NRRL 8057 = DSM 46488]